ncbi:MAG: hypothetical protein LBU14_00405 [Candidatus Peribacteria bacterium]|jgi:hypothetical protein|nr:hypothetical protein [Candidatus Peribacteria bacterium]
MQKIYSKVKKSIIKEDVENTKIALNKLDLNAKKENYKKAQNTKRLTNDEIKQLTELLRRVQLNSSK